MKGPFEINYGVILGPNKRVNGNGNTITGPNARVHGNKNTVTGPNAYVEGNNNIVIGPNAFVIGDNNRVKGPNARAEGANNIVDDSPDVTFGMSNVTIRNGTMTFFNEKKKKKQKKKDEEEEEFLSAPTDVKEDQEAKEGENTCVICLTFKAKCLITPCNHLCLCINCSSTLCFGPNKDELKRVGEVHCPKCRNEIKSIQKVFE